MSFLSGARWVSAKLNEPERDGTETPKETSERQKVETPKEEVNPGAPGTIGRNFRTSGGGGVRSGAPPPKLVTSIDILAQSSAARRRAEDQRIGERRTGDRGAGGWRGGGRRQGVSGGEFLGVGGWLSACRIQRGLYRHAPGERAELARFRPGWFLRSNHSRPDSRKLKYALRLKMMWSKSATPMISPAAFSCLVTSTSIGEGSRLPAG